MNGNKWKVKTQKKAAVPRKWIVLWSLAAVCLLAVCIGCISLTDRKSGRIYPVCFSEISASNTVYPNQDGRICDYLELYNTAEYPVDLTGFSIGDIEGSTRYDFPDGTILGAGEWLVVWCDAEVNEESYASFGISRSGGEEYCLIAANRAVADRVVTVPMDTDEAMVLGADGTWLVTSAPSPGSANDTVMDPVQEIYHPSLSPVRISEFSSAENVYSPELERLCDWVELYNTAAEPVDISGYRLSDNVGNDKYIIPQGTVIPASGYMVICCAGEELTAGTAPFAFSSLGGEDVVLKNQEGRIIELAYTVPMESGSRILTESGWENTEHLSPGYANTDDGHNAFMTAIGAEAGRITISELMSGEQYLLQDGTGNFSDWIELHNSGTEPVNLAGWMLTDDLSREDVWMFPSFEIAPGGYAVVYCSGDGIVTENAVHTEFSLSSAGESVTLISSAGIISDSVAFAQAESNQSFVRDAEGNMTLCSTPSPGYVNDAAGAEAFAASMVPEGPLAIWEVMTANDWYLPQQLGECYDWVEICNVSEQVVQLSDYCLTDDADTPDMYRLPERALAPGQTTVIILSGDTSLSTEKYAHASFALNAAEDKLILYHADGSLSDHVWLEDIPYGMSVGRSTASGGFFYMNPTPNAPNEEGYRQISAEPVSSLEAGVYTTEEAVTLELEAPGTIYYTLDGSDPDEGAVRYEGPVTVDSTCVFRAAAIEQGKVRSDIYTATFLMGEEHIIPVVSLVTDPDNLWSGSGIYKNFLEIKEESREANLAYSGDDGSFSIDCEISLHGATTVLAFDKKSFTVRFKDRYEGTLHYDMFEDGEVTDYRSLILRAAHESTVSTHMHDVLMSELAEDCTDGLITQKAKYAALYLNGEYWGLYAIREHHSQEHYASYMNVPADSVNMVRFATDDGNGLYEIYRFCIDNDLSIPENYAYVEERLDVTSFADWAILQAYCSNFDINENMRYYLSTADGKWRCGLTDLDLGFFDYPVFDGVFQTFHHGVFTSNLIENESFRMLIAQRLAILLEGSLADDYVAATIDEIAGTIRDEVTRDAERWGYDPFVWEQFVSEMKRFCENRAEMMTDSLCSELGLTQAERAEIFHEGAEV